MTFDSQGRLVAGSPYGWLTRYSPAGVPDTGFNERSIAIAQSGRGAGTTSTVITEASGDILVGGFHGLGSYGESALSVMRVFGRAIPDAPSRPFGKLRRVRYGVAWTLRCPIPAGAGQLQGIRAPRRGRPGPRPARRRHRAAGKRRLVVKLKRADRKRLDRRGKLAVSAKATVRHGGGASATHRTARRALVLRAPKGTSPRARR